MSATIIPFEALRRSAQRADCDGGIDATQSEAVSPDHLRTEISRLERLDHDMQVQAHRINLAIGAIRRERLALLRRIADLRSA